MNMAIISVIDGDSVERNNDDDDVSSGSTIALNGNVTSAGDVRHRRR